MIEVFRKGFRLDVDPNTLVTFKKSQNLNGIQARYGYSNTISLDKTANNKKLLELFDLPTNKVSTLMNGFEVDVVLNGSIQLRNQIMKITKESLNKIDIYFLWSDNAVVPALKSTYLNALVEDFKYKFSLADFNALKNGGLYRTGFVETQPKSGFYVIEEMPVLIKIQELMRRIFTANNYTVYGDFFSEEGTFKDYYVTPNKGIYHIYPGTGDGYPPTFDPNLDAFSFLSQTLAFFNCYVTVDDTYKTAVVNSWANLGNYKSNYVDYSRFFLDYQDYTFQSKLAKRNELTYSESGATFNSFFINNLSSEVKNTYLNTAFGTGSLNIFDDATLDDTGTIPIRVDGEEGETSAVRIFKIDSADTTLRVFKDGIRGSGVFFNDRKITAKKAVAVSMNDVYNEFHKDYIDFILTPLVTYHFFRYDDILAADFSLTEVYFVEQLASYWIPLEVNYSTKKDKVTVKAMLVKKRKVESPILNNFNSVLLDFKEKALFPLSYLQSMYPMPPNANPWDVVVFRSYDQNKNSLYINDSLVPALSLPQAFIMGDIASIKIEANKPSDLVPDTNTAPINLVAIDTAGGVSNEAYINIKHTGVASYESNFAQAAEYEEELLASLTPLNLYVKPFEYYVGGKPNLNNTVTTPGVVEKPAPDDDFNLVVASQDYTNQVKVKISAFTMTFNTNLLGTGDYIVGRLCVFFNGTEFVLREFSSTGLGLRSFSSASISSFHSSLPIGGKIRVYMKFAYKSTRTVVTINDLSVDISTTVTL